MDDLEPKDLEHEEEEDVEEIDDLLVSGKKKGKKEEDEDSLDELADEEGGVLPEDSFDDVDLW